MIKLYSYLLWWPYYLHLLKIIWTLLLSMWIQRFFNYILQHMMPLASSQCLAYSFMVLKLHLHSRFVSSQRIVSLLQIMSFLWQWLEIHSQGGSASQRCHWRESVSLESWGHHFAVEMNNKNIIIKSGFRLPWASILSMNRNLQALEKKKKKTISKKKQNLQCIISLNRKTWLIIGTGKKKCFKMAFKGI